MPIALPENRMWADDHITGGRQRRRNVRRACGSLVNSVGSECERSTAVNDRYCVHCCSATRGSLFLARQPRNLNISIRTTEDFM